MRPVATVAGPKPLAFLQSSDAAFRTAETPFLPYRLGNALDPCDSLQTEVVTDQYNIAFSNLLVIGNEAIVSVHTPGLVQIAGIPRVLAIFSE